MTKPHLDKLSLQESVLASAALKKIGNATVGYYLSPTGNRFVDNRFSADDGDSLVSKFRADPKDSLGYMRQNLFAINRDTRILPIQRPERLGRYLDAYTNLTVKLDRAAFTEGDNGDVHFGIPPYIPDGLVDMGSEATLTTIRRNGRDQIKVDKLAIYRRYREVLLGIFSTNFPDATDTTAKEYIAQSLMQAVYYRLPYDHAPHESNAEYAGIVNLHELSEGVCRHQALTYQVLAQACGLTSRLLKCTMDGYKHATNATRINNEWYFVDVTNPDMAKNSRGVRTWHPAAFKIPHEPRNGEKYTFTKPNSHATHTYSIRGDMFWRIDK